MSHGSFTWIDRASDSSPLDGWSLLGGNQFVKAERLYKLGWEPAETKKLSLLDSFPETIEQALRE